MSPPSETAVWGGFRHQPEEGQSSGCVDLALLYWPVWPSTPSHTFYPQHSQEASTPTFGPLCTLLSMQGHSYQLPPCCHWNCVTRLRDTLSRSDLPRPGKLFPNTIVLVTSSAPFFPGCRGQGVGEEEARPTNWI